jgi:mono/diheme cytochrome c family protein/glucose/arabinose dehydrogenase
VLAAVLPSAAQTPVPAATRAPQRGTVERNATREQELLQQTKVPDGFTVTVFAGPPAAMYPTCLATAPDGALFVCVDPNLSLSQNKGVGRIVRLVDDDGDGRADRYTVFAEMDSPRGVVFDGRTLYVMHPPTLTAYRDTDGDGIADKSEDLVRGLGFDLNFRGADHSTNQITMGIDGWLYVAVGDYGYQSAVGKDGTTIRHRGGSVVRVRPDGTGLEIYAVGTRNIYDLAVDPFLRVYSRDNTNDGDGWDTRLHYIPALAHMGYPMYYKNFPEDHMPSLHDYGEGAGTGALWVHDPRFPEGFNNNLYTGDWTLNKVFRHTLTPNGASFDITQDDFLSIPRPSDMVMDERSNMYVASLVGGTFTYAGDTVGAVVRVRPAGRRDDPGPILEVSLDNDALLDALASPYTERRLQAQRELLRRARPGPLRGFLLRRSLRRRLTELTLDTRRPDYARVAYMFTLKQLAGAGALPVLLRAAADPSLRALALRALTDHPKQLKGVPVALFVESLHDADPRVQLQAITGLVRLGARDAASAIVPLAASPDRAVAHIAINALVAFDAPAPALATADTGSSAARRGALRALRQMHSAFTVSALTQQLRSAHDSSTRRDLLFALARLYNREGPWNGEWWTTRPSFLGPYFAPTPWEQSAAIKPLLRDALLSARGAELDTIAGELIRDRVLPQGARTMLVAIQMADQPQREEVIDALLGGSQLSPAAIALLPTLDSQSDRLHAAVAQLLAGQTAIGEQLLPLVRKGALDSTLDAEIQGRLLNSVAQMPDSSARAAAATAALFVRVTPSRSTPTAVEMAWRRYVGNRRRVQELDSWIRLAQTGEPAERTLAFSVLAQSVRSPRAPQPLRDRVHAVIDAAWSDSVAAPSLVQAIRVMKLENQYTERLAAYDQLHAAKAVEQSTDTSAAQVTRVAGRNERPDSNRKEWIQLFNGRDLSGWDIKFRGHPLNDNFNDTFRAEDGLLKVRYDKWTTFNGEFGHIFYKRPFSSYVVAAEYRFVGDQVTGAGPRNSWAIRNNGIMIHSQSAESMGLDQDFPISLEVQLLGGLGKGPRSTANLCTPGTNVYFGDTLVTRHCINSTSQTYDGDQWVRVEALVIGDSVIKHIVNGDTVLTYRKPEMGGGNASSTKPGVLQPGKKLIEGYIVLQAETAPIDFRKVEVLELRGCKDPKAQNYKSYYVESDPSACRYEVRSAMTQRRAEAMPGSASCPASLAPTRAQLQVGRRLYGTTCAACHQAVAQGVPDKYPPLAESEWVTGDERRLLRVIVHGLTGEIDVQGETFNGAMPGWGPTLKDADIAAIATYVRNNFGNRASAITPEAVARVRQDFAARKDPWTRAELAHDAAAKRRSIPACAPAATKKAGGS